MTALVVYESMFGNTRSVASSIGTGLSRHLEVGLVAVDRCPTLDGDVFDLVVVGGPTHAFSMSRPATRADVVAVPRRSPRSENPWSRSLDEKGPVCELGALGVHASSLLGPGRANRSPCTGSGRSSCGQPRG